MSRFKMYRIQLLEYMVLFALFLFKASLFYILIENGYSGARLSLLSLIYIIPIIAIANTLRGIKQFVSILIFYTVISLTMFADVIYFKYFNALTSITLLKQINQLTAIGDSISYVVKPINFLIIGDIIPLILFYIFLHKYKIKNYLHFKGKSKIIFSILSVAIIIFLIKTMDKDSYSQEFFTYHISDVYSVLFAEPDEDIVDVDKMIKESIIRTVNKEKDLYGVAKGRNIITIQVEGLQYFVINKEYEGQEITPSINNLIKNDSLYFDRYYQLLGRGNTSDAEFVSHNSLYPAMDGQTYIKYYDNIYYGLPWILKENGFSATALHGYKASFWNRNRAYIYQGFDRYYNGDADYLISNPIIGFGINDSEFFAQSLNYVKSLKKPYYAFLITLSSHHPYNMNDMYKKIKLNPKHENTLFGKYIQAINFADSALGEFINGLKNEGHYENAMINVYGDHFGLSLNEKNKNYMTKYLGYEYNFDEMMRVPLIIHIPRSGIRSKISVTGSQLDFLPTVLNLIGIENKKGIMLGQDLVNAKEGIAAEQTYMQKGSFIKGDVVFLMSRDGLFKNSRAWKISTRESIDLSQCRKDYEMIIKQINQSDYILKNNVLRKYFPERVVTDKTEKTPMQYIIPEKYIISIHGSKETLDDTALAGHNFIELEFSWLSGNLTAKSLVKMNVEGLVKWLCDHKDICIITDIKNNNIEGLRLIKDKYPEIAHQIIPQIYRIDEFIPAQGFGYENIILNLCDSNYSNDEILDFIKRHKVFAVVLPVDAIHDELIENLKKEYTFIYVRAGSEPAVINGLWERGVDGFFVDTLVPSGN